MEGPLSRVKSIKKSLRQSFRRIRRSRVSLRKHHVNNAAKVALHQSEGLNLMRLQSIPSFNLLFFPTICSSRRQTLVWRQSWQRWSWLRCKGRLRLAHQMIRSPVLYGHSTLQTLFSQTVSQASKIYMCPMRKLNIP